MADATLAPRPALDGVAVPGRYGRPDGAPGVIVAERKGLALATIMARHGREGELARAMRDGFGLEPPERPRRVAAGDLALVGAGPGQWLAVGEGEFADNLEGRLAARLSGLAAVADQSDGRMVLRLAGPRLREALAKGCPVDLHPRAFAPGDAALTAIAYMGVHLWQLDPAPTFEIAVSRSYAESFWRWLTASAAEFGYEVREGF